MGDQASKDEVYKQRIISHMNKDHQDSLVRYLRHRCGLSSFSARNAHMEDISLSDLTISTSSHQKYTISIKPPLADWSDARPRVVAMDHEAVAALGLSNITVKSYRPPSGMALIPLVAVVGSFLVFSRRGNFESGSLLHDLILYRAPRFNQFCWTIQPALISFMVVVHIVEATWIARTRLAKHSVPLGSRLWWAWIISNVCEGIGAFIRFDEIVKEEEVRRASAKH